MPNIALKLSYMYISTFQLLIFEGKLIVLEKHFVMSFLSSVFCYRSLLSCQVYFLFDIRFIIENLLLPLVLLLCTIAAVYNVGSCHGNCDGLRQWFGLFLLTLQSCHCIQSCIFH